MLMRKDRKAEGFAKIVMFLILTGGGSLTILNLLQQGRHDLSERQLFPGLRLFR